MSRRKRAIKPFDWPAWLVALAAQDKPPAELTDELRGRLQTAGVEELFPADFTSRKRLEAEREADAIGAAIDGFPCIEPLFDGPTRTADSLDRLCTFVQKFDRLRTLRLAAIDMGFVAAGARALADGEPAAVRAFSRILETGIVVTYARPYLDSNKPALGKKYWPSASDDVALHDKVVDEYRHAYHAHSHRTKRRTLLDTTDMLGLDGPPNYAEAWHGLAREDLERLADLAERQSARLHDAADVIGSELGEQHDRPSYPPLGARVDYRWDGDVDTAFERLREALRQQADINDA